MKVVIDIPEWKYKSICEGVEASKRCGVVGIDHNVHEAIYNGTALPKGHGRLADLDKIIQFTYDTYGINSGKCITDDNRYIIDYLYNGVETIIEADKGE